MGFRFVIFLSQPCDQPGHSPALLDPSCSQHLVSNILAHNDWEITLVDLCIILLNYQDLANRIDKLIYVCWMHV